MSYPSYQHFWDLLHKSPRRAIRPGIPLYRRKLQCNTYVYQQSLELICVRLHDTDIVIYHEDGTVELDTGGYWTVTTKDRMNLYSPHYVFCVNDQWWVTLLDRSKDRWDPNPRHTYAMNRSHIAIPTDKRASPHYRADPKARLTRLDVYLRQQRRQADRRKAQSRQQTLNGRQAKKYGAWLKRHHLVNHALGDELQRIREAAAAHYTETLDANRRLGDIIADLQQQLCEAGSVPALVYMPMSTCHTDVDRERVIQLQEPYRPERSDREKHVGAITKEGRKD